MTTRQRWEKIDRIFAAALELEPAEREEFLEQACKGDEQLRSEVDSLLAHDIPDSLVGSPEEATRILDQVRNGFDRTIGPYRIVKELGAGGMGQVYLCHDTRLNRSVALKFLSQYEADEEERIRRFRQEALAASALNHPNIVTIYEIGEFEGQNFIATEFIDGVTLRGRMDAGGLSPIESLDIAIQVAQALAAAHAAGIVHRDIKPDNIMIRSDGLVKVLDFGVAKYSQQVSESLQADTIVETTPGVVVGTAAYMSPEQARGILVDARTDIWSLGAVLFEMVARRRPFSGNTPIDALAAVLERQPAAFSISGISFGANEDLKRIIFKSLEKDREVRYESASAMARDMKALTKRLELAAAGEPSEPQSGTYPQTNESIAVLPFVNMSGDAENEYFCDGLAEELLNALTKIDDLKVAARTSAFSFKGKNTNVSEIGRALGVNKVVEGSVRKSGNNLRISVQLINAADGYQLWSERYDRQMQDIFDLQDELTMAVVDALKMKLLVNEKAVLKRYTDNAEAYELYLKGRYHWYRQTPTDLEKSRDYFQKAIDLDPTYALGYAGLSEYYGLSSALGLMPPDFGWPKSEETMKRAQELDNSLAEVHNGLAGLYLTYYRDWSTAKSELARAIELNPKLSEVRLLYSLGLVATGNLDDAIAKCKSALHLDPLSTRHRNWLGNWLYYSRRYDEAIKQYREVLELDPNNFLVHEPLGDAYEQNKMYDQAIAEWQNAMMMIGDTAGAVSLGNIHQVEGFKPALNYLMERKVQSMNRQIESGNFVSAGHLARAYARLGQTQLALDWIEKTVEERSVFALFIYADPVYDTLRSEARFQASIERLRFV